MIEKEVKVQAPPKEDGLTDLLATDKTHTTKKLKKHDYDKYLVGLEYNR
ncbi:MAG: hypothetical protein ACMXYG_00160 [Candidatus Woesearchaeota archaeon]